MKVVNGWEAAAHTQENTPTKQNVSCQSARIKYSWPSTYFEHTTNIVLLLIKGAKAYQQTFDYIYWQFKWTVWSFRMSLPR